MTQRVQPAPHVGAVLASLQGDEPAVELTPVQAVASEADLTPAPAIVTVGALDAESSATSDSEPAGAAVAGSALVPETARPPADQMTAQVVANLLASAAVDAQKLLDEAAVERDAILARARADADAYLAARVARIVELRDGLTHWINDLTDLDQNGPS
jgi:cell division septum initiation protein DivIVA